MKHIIICLGLLVGMFGYGHAQSADAQAKKSEEIVLKMRQLDLLNQIIPLALKKDQINKLLPAVEKARAKVKEIQKSEASALDKLSGKVNAAIAKSIETGVTPPRELLQEVAEATMDMSLRRQVVVGENTELVLKVFNETLDAGQKKAAANSLAPQLLDPSLKPDQMTEQDKIRFFIREILLDPQAYDILLQLEKHTS